MKLRIKPEYIEFSAGIAGRKMVKLKNLPVSNYERYYKLFPGYFEVIEEDKKDKPSKTKKKNDKNNSGNDSIGVSNTDREGDTK
jgi:hypothetical protein